MLKPYAALLLAAMPAATQAMPAAEFLARAEALEKKGAMALFSSDIGILKKEIQASGKWVRAEQSAARKQGGKLPYCMPEKAAVTSSELLAHLRAIPKEQRSMPVRMAFAGLIRRKYPCPG